MRERTIQYSFPGDVDLEPDRRDSGLGCISADTGLDRDARWLVAPTLQRCLHACQGVIGHLQHLQEVGHIDSGRLPGLRTDHSRLMPKPIERLRKLVAARGQSWLSNR